MRISCDVHVYSDELGRKMDNKRQEISTCQKSLGEMERRVHQYRQEQVPAFTEWEFAMMTMQFLYFK